MPFEVKEKHPRRVLFFVGYLFKNSDMCYYIKLKKEGDLYVLCKKV